MSHTLLFQAAPTKCGNDEKKIAEAIQTCEKKHNMKVPDLVFELEDIQDDLKEKMQARQLRDLLRKNKPKPAKPAEDLSDVEKIDGLIECVYG